MHPRLLLAAVDDRRLRRSQLVQPRHYYFFLRKMLRQPRVGRMMPRFRFKQAAIKRC
jgi:hypothetical protein